MIYLPLGERGVITMQAERKAGTDLLMWFIFIYDISVPQNKNDPMIIKKLAFDILVAFEVCVSSSNFGHFFSRVPIGSKRWQNYTLCIAKIAFEYKNE